MNSCDLDEYWNTKVPQRNGLSPKRIKLEPYEDWDIQFKRNDIVNCLCLNVVYIYFALDFWTLEDESNHK